MPAGTANRWTGTGPAPAAWHWREIGGDWEYEAIRDSLTDRHDDNIWSGKIAKRTPESVDFHTPTSILGVRGTEFVIEVEGDGDE